MFSSPSSDMISESGTFKWSLIDVLARCCDFTVFTILQDKYRPSQADSINDLSTVIIAVGNGKTKNKIGIKKLERNVH